MSSKFIFLIFCIIPLQAMQQNNPLVTADLQGIPADAQKLIILALAQTPLNEMNGAAYLKSKSKHIVGGWDQRRRDYIYTDLDQNMTAIRALRQTCRRFRDIFTNDLKFTEKVILNGSQQLLAHSPHALPRYISSRIFKADIEPAALKQWLDIVDMNKTIGKVGHRSTAGIHKFDDSVCRIQ